MMKKVAIGKSMFSKEFTDSEGVLYKCNIEIIHPSDSESNNPKIAYDCSGNSDFKMIMLLLKYWVFGELK